MSERVLADLKTLPHGEQAIQVRLFTLGPYVFLTQSAARALRDELTECIRKWVELESKATEESVHTAFRYEFDKHPLHRSRAGFDRSGRSLSHSVRD